MNLPAADAWILLLHNVRYSMGRMSAAPSSAQSLVQIYNLLLTDGQLAQICREVREELARMDDLRYWSAKSGEVCHSGVHWLGHEHDHRGWQTFVEWCDRELERRKGAK